MEVFHKKDDTTKMIPEPHNPPLSSQTQKDAQKSLDIFSDAVSLSDVEKEWKDTSWLQKQVLLLQQENQVLKLQEAEDRERIEILLNFIRHPTESVVIGIGKEPAQLQLDSSQILSISSTGQTFTKSFTHRIKGLGEIYHSRHADMIERHNEELRKALKTQRMICERTIHKVCEHCAEIEEESHRVLTHAKDRVLQMECVLAASRRDCQVLGERMKELEIAAKNAERERDLLKQELSESIVRERAKARAQLVQLSKDGERKLFIEKNSHEKLSESIVRERAKARAQLVQLSKDGERKLFIEKNSHEKVLKQLRKKIEENQKVFVEKSEQYAVVARQQELKASKAVRDLKFALQKIKRLEMYGIKE
ncbi:hypothetical protein ADUPG1_013527 [Aduncisulcus paluster]|uniref:Uncharacterized protein n=1 Tax=Aduncisulcus paluster TaxID=2918883 RepID=A0ABQ5K808_9EUKA|nr:hypothetical protein ADUPG1_013527 [Aduncisulcus paluster]